MFRRISVQITLLVTLALIISLFFTLDLRQLGNILGNVNLAMLSLSFAVLSGEIFLRGVRLKDILRAYYPVSLQNACLVTLVGFPFALVTPGRVGDLVKFLTLSRKTPISVSSGIAAGIFEKILELLSLFIAAALGILAVLVSSGASPLLLILLVLFLAGSAFLFLIIHRGTSSLSFVFTLIPKTMPPSLRVTAKSVLEKFHQNLSMILRINPSGVSPFIISLALWAVRLVHVFILALSLGLPLKVLYFFALMPLAFIAELLPISVMGLGVREYSFILLFKFADLPPESAVALSLLVFAFGFLPPAIIGYLLALKEYRGAPSRVI